jgi:hypothetical protein
VACDYFALVFIFLLTAAKEQRSSKFHCSYPKENGNKRYKK